MASDNINMPMLSKSFSKSELFLKPQIHIYNCVLLGVESHETDSIRLFLG